MTIPTRPENPEADPVGQVVFLQYIYSERLAGRSVTEIRFADRVTRYSLPTLTEIRAELLYWQQVAAATTGERPRRYAMRLGARASI